MKNFSVTQFGKPLDPSKYTWDETARTFSTNESDLVLDFSNMGYCTFATGSDCTFTTGFGCTFKTGSDCTFKTGAYCTFATGSDCTFATGSYCTFKTGSDCTFTTGYNCTFTTSSDCTFKTGYNCTFTTGYNCTFTTGYNCTFTTGSNCVVVRWDIFEVHQLVEGETIKLNNYQVPSFVKIVETKDEILERLVEKLKTLSVDDLKKMLK